MADAGGPGSSPPLLGFRRDPTSRTRQAGADAEGHWEALAELAGIEEPRSSAGTSER